MKVESFVIIVEKTLGIKLHPWQVDLIASPLSNKMLRIPTGLGKTLAILLAWIYHRLVLKDKNWPARLIWVLPQRVLTEQTASEVKRVLEALKDLLNREDQNPVGVHILMGGEERDSWEHYPEKEAVLIGTLDMILSRALNRGYGSARAKWPMEFGLFSQDSLFVLDEVQLMGVALRTFTQLQIFRDKDKARWLRPSYTWFSSATTQRSWLESLDSTEFLKDLPALVEIPRKDQVGGLWDLKKNLHPVANYKDIKNLCNFVIQKHRVNEGTTLVIVNTVKKAKELYKEIQKKNKKGEVGEIRLVHSHFRQAEKEKWKDAFLSKEHCGAKVHRLIITTQVIEAGVDISCSVLITELAPWPSLIQRFGRNNRWYWKELEQGEIFIVKSETLGPKKKNEALPYSYEELEAAEEALKKVQNDFADASVLSLEKFERGLSDDERKKLYPYNPTFELGRQDIEQLFDTSLDLSGGEFDISRFIRGGDERDVYVYWDNITKTEKGKDGPPKKRWPKRAELCSVPFLEFRNWLKAHDIKQGVFIWDWIIGEWIPLNPSQNKTIFPGRFICLSREEGAYNDTLGWDIDEKNPVEVLPLKNNIEVDKYFENDNEEGGDPSSEHNLWQTIPTHSENVLNHLKAILNELGPFCNKYDFYTKKIEKSLLLTPKWHDYGKSHRAFRNCIKDLPDPCEIYAKAPEGAWKSKNNLYQVDNHYRKGFRHELASALGLLKLKIDNPTLSDFKDLSETEFDLLLYLVASHHGKVRLRLNMSPQDQDFDSEKNQSGLPLRGVLEGDTLPSFHISPSHQQPPLPEVKLTLEPASFGLSPITGESWAERMAILQEEITPWTLAYLEALIRAADIRASK